MAFVNIDAMIYHLSYEVTHWEPGHFCGCYLSYEGIDDRINEIILHSGEKQAM